MLNLKNKKVQHLSMGPADAAFVFRSNGKIELAFPNITGEDVPSHLFEALSFAHALANKKMRQTFKKHFLAKHNIHDSTQPANDD